MQKPNSIIVLIFIQNFSMLKICLPQSMEVSVFICLFHGIQDINGCLVRYSSNSSFRLSSVVSALAMFLGISSAVSLQITCANL